MRGSLYRDYKTYLPINVIDSFFLLPSIVSQHLSLQDCALFLRLTLITLAALFVLIYHLQVLQKVRASRTSTIRILAPVQRSVLMCWPLFRSQCMSCMHFVCLGSYLSVWV